MLKLPLRPRTLEELRRLGGDFAHLADGKRGQRVAALLSAEARQDVEAWVGQLRAMPTEKRAHLATNTLTLQALLSLAPEQRDHLRKTAHMLNQLLTMVAAEHVPQRGARGGPHTPGTVGVQAPGHDSPRHERVTSASEEPGQLSATDGADAASDCETCGNAPSEPA
jgi:hypothetical protein